MSTVEPADAPTSPQLEGGYVRFANEIVEAFCRSFPGRGEGQVLWFVLRKTYGWHKKEDHIPLSQIVEGTGLCRRMAIYCLQNLEAKRMITVSRKRGRGNKNEINTIAFQKNYSLWVVQEKSRQYEKALKNRKLSYRKSKGRVVQEDRGGARNPSSVVQETRNNGEFLAPSKDTSSKDTYQKIDSLSPPSTAALECAQLLSDKIFENVPNRTAPTEKQLLHWARDLEKLHRIDGHPYDEIREVLEWSQADPFWRANILSGGKLREKWNTLVAKKAQQNGRGYGKEQFGTAEPKGWQGIRDADELLKRRAHRL